MWSLLLRKAILCVLYVLLLYCDVIVLSQRLRIYDTLDNDPLSNHRSHSGGNYSDVFEDSRASTRTPLIHRTKASDDSQYVHGMTYQEHKRVAAASEPYTQYRRYRFNAVNAPSVPSWRIARTTEAPPIESTTVAEMPHSYFGTTQKPLSFDSESYWPDRYGSRSRAKPTVRVESIVNSTFGQARIETGLKPRNICCQNDTESSGDQARGRFRFYNSFSRDRGYAPHRAVQLVTTTTTSTTTDRPAYRWNERYSSSRGYNQFHERASSLGLSSSGRVVGARESSATWSTTRSPNRLYTTTWVPRTTKERIDNTALNSLWNTNRYSEVDVEPYHRPGTLPRSGFDGVRGIRPWDDRPTSTSTTTSTTRRPAMFAGTKVDEYDYYDELEKRQTSTTEYPWISDWRRTTESPTTPRSFDTPAPRSNPYDRWIFQGPTTTSTTPSPYVEYPPGPIYKPYDEDRDFNEWKSQVEQRVQRIRRPSGRTRTPASRMRVTGSPSLENDLVPLFKVSGIEEEDWKFVHETNRLEDDFKAGGQRGHERYRSEWGNDFSSDWRADRKESRHDSLGPSRRTTRTTAETTTIATSTTTTKPPQTEPWTPPPRTETENSTSPPKPFVPPTRRFVPRKPVVYRRRTTPRSRSGPKYSFRLYTPPESASEMPSLSERASALSPETTTAESTQGTSSHSAALPRTEQYSTESRSSLVGNVFPSAPFMTTAREITAPATTSTTASLNSTAFAAPTATTAYPYTAPIMTTAPSITTTVRPSTATSPETRSPVEVHWLTTRKPVFGEGMSIEQQLAEAMRRLQERKKNKEIEKEKNLAENEGTRKQQFDGSGDWENDILNDAPIIVESVPEVADFNLRDDVTVEHVRKRVSENLGDAEIFGDLLNEHIMQVNGQRKSLKSNARRHR